MTGSAEIDRVSLVVADLDHAERDYRDALGFALESRGAIDPALMHLLGVRGARGRRSTLRLGDERIDLLEFTGPAGRAYPADSTSTDLWFQHLAIAVSDIADAHRRVLAGGRFRPISRNGPVQLPERSGGVTAFKFRDADGHPLELIEFTGAPMPSRAATPAGPFLGVDHTAISVSDTAASADFFGSVFGLGTGAHTENVGPEQEDLDDVRDVAVTVTRIAPERSAPRLELLHYHAGRRRPIPRPTRGNDIAATHSVLQVESLDPMRTALERRGEQVSDVVACADGTRAAMAASPDGHRFLVEESRTS